MWLMCSLDSTLYVAVNQTLVKKGPYTTVWVLQLSTWSPFYSSAWLKNANTGSGRPTSGLSYLSALHTVAPGEGAAFWCSKRNCFIYRAVVETLPLQSSFSLESSSSCVECQSGQYLICQTTSLKLVFMSHTHETTSIFSNVSILQLCICISWRYYLK